VQATVNALSTSQRIYQQISLLGSEEVMEGVKDLLKFVPSIPTIFKSKKREKKTVTYVWASQSPA